MGQTDCNQAPFGGFGPGGMMGWRQNFTGTMPFGMGIMGGCQAGFNGMMGGMMNMMGMMHGGMGNSNMMGGTMMGGHMMTQSSPFFRPDPLTLTEASAAVDDYLVGLNDDNLELGEVMIFDNHAYAQIVEKESGIGAMEVLIDPVTRAITPEMGPNMMWNQKYGIMGGFGSGGMMGGMMGDGTGFNNQGMMNNRGGMMGNANTPAASSEMAISEADAVEIAQAYLDAYVGNNLIADEHADPFYGYYTLHVERNGETMGMLLSLIHI